MREVERIKDIEVAKSKPKEYDLDALLVERSYGREVDFDGEGYVYGYPSQVDVDGVVKDGKTFHVETKSSATRGDLAAFAKKAQP